MAANTSLDSLAKNRTLIIAAGIALVAMVTLFIVNAVNYKPPTGSNASLKANLVMWGVWDESALIRNYITDFKKIYPGVEIEYRKLTIQEYETELVNALAEGRGPDIFAMHHTWLGKHKNKMQPMPEATMTLREYQERFLDVVQSDFILEDKVWGFPLYTDTMALFYNKDAFNDAGIANPPTTWAEVQATSEKLTKIDQFGNITQSGIALGTGENINRSPDILSVLMIQSGAEMTDPNRPDTITFTRNVNINGQRANPSDLAMQFYTDFSNPRKTVYTWNSAQNYSIDAFYEREVAMILGYSYQVEQIKARAPRLNFGIAPLPQITTGQGVANYANYWGYTVSAQSEHAEASYAFLKFVTEKEQAQDYFLATKRPTARRDLVEVQSEDTEYGIFVDQTIQAKTWRQPDNNAVDRIFIEAIDSVNRGVANYTQAMSKAASEIQLLAESL